MDRRTFLAGALLLLAADALGADGGYTALVVMRRAGCPTCRAELLALLEAGGLAVVGLTADDAAAAARAARETGAVVRSDPARLRALGLLDPSGEGRPAVVLLDPCGDEVGRLLGRAPGRLAAPAVLELWRRAPPPKCGGALRS